MAGKVIGITLVVAVVGGIALATTLERRGEDNARAFRPHATVGHPMQEIVALAEAARKRRPYVQVSSREIVVRFNGASPFPWHGCVVKIVDGKVFEARYEYLD